MALTTLSRSLHRSGHRLFASLANFDLFNPTEEHKALREMVRDFSENEVAPQATEFNREEKLNVPLLKQCGELGLLGITVPEQFGGSGMDAVAAVIAHEELSAVDPAFCLAYLAHSMLFVNNLAVNGNDEQRMRILPDACSGAKIGGMCMSEPGVGTDVLSLRTSARRDGDEYVVNGTKMWITNGTLGGGELGDVFLVYARTAPKDISFFMVEKGMEGFSLGQQLRDKCGMRASATAELVFENVRVPSTNLLGAEGDAVSHMMRNLELERLTLAAMSLGISKRCLQVMIKYSKDREAFGSPLHKFGQIQKHIGDSYAEYMAARSYVYNVARHLQLGSSGNRIDSDGVKLFASAVGKTIADRAMQVLGGYGYLGEYDVERLWRDSKLLEIGGGTSEAHEKNMTGDLVRLDDLPL